MSWLGWPIGAHTPWLLELVKKYAISTNASSHLRISVMSPQLLKPGNKSYRNRKEWREPREREKQKIKAVVYGCKALRRNLDFYHDFKIIFTIYQEGKLP